jgi:hypothetical protein
MAGGVRVAIFYELPGILDGFGIDEITLIRLHVRLDILGRHQPHIVALLAQRSPKKMRALQASIPIR